MTYPTEMSTVYKTAGLQLCAWKYL